MKKSLIAALICVNSSVAYAAPAPVEDLSSGSSDQRLQRIERVVKAKQQTDFALQQQVDRLQQEVQDLRGLIEQQNYQSEQMLQRQRQLYDDIAKLQQAPVAPPVASIAPTASTGVATPKVVAPATTETVINDTTTLSETASYENAVNLVLKQRQYDQAIPAFKEFIATYPQSTYAANANYWLGQLLFNKAELNEAKVAFDTVVTKFPDSNKRPDSLVKLGLIAEKTNQAALAKTLYTQVRKEYPESSAARIAAQQLAGL
ncbi:MAG: tol-pal system protein YbgF [Shewanella sp.]